jgi:hypothetical protein
MKQRIPSYSLCTALPGTPLTLFQHTHTHTVKLRLLDF